MMSGGRASTRSSPGRAVWPKGSGTAVLGGSFDPPHRSHARLLLEAGHHLPVDRILVIPAGDHPHKQGTGMTNADHRLAMCHLAFDPLPGVTVDDRELRRSGPSFTADTLAELRAEAPGRRLFFLIGSDNLPLLPTWRDHHRLLSLAVVVTYPRRGYPVDERALRDLDLSDAERASLLANVLPLEADDVSASAIRARLRTEGRSPDVSSEVADYIAAHALYRA